MKRTKMQKVIVSIILIMSIVLLFNSNTVFAAINTEYSRNDEVVGNNLDKAFDASGLLKSIVKFVYVIAEWLEWLLGIIFKLLTGSSDFPWADKIVFNSVALLDINFFNAHPESFVGQPAIYALLQKLYATILAIAITFFGIAVAITALKLLISTIASEKAKYKQAIVDWVVGLVMILCIHYFISFVFYLNEQLVLVASRIVSAQLEGKNDFATSLPSQSVEDLIKNAGNRKYLGYYQGTRRNVPIREILSNNKTIVEYWLTLETDDLDYGLYSMLMGDMTHTTVGVLVLGVFDLKIPEEDRWQYLALIIAWAEEHDITAERLREIKSNHLIESKDSVGCYQAVTLGIFQEMFGTGYRYEQLLKATQQPSTLKKYDDEQIVYSATETKGLYFSYNMGWRWKETLDDLILLKEAARKQELRDENREQEKTRLISDLASYFKVNSHQKVLDEGSVGLTKTGNINIQNMIMYAILIGQSVILFISYVKRLFYVLILAMMAPVVVVMDFFQKFGK